MKKIIYLAAIAMICRIAAGYGNSVCWADPQAQDTQVEKKNEKVCRVCGMYIERFKRTAVYVEYAGGGSQAYCGVSCAIRAINEHGGFDSVRSAQVTGWTSQERLDMKQATYVIGSRLIPDMLPNIIAFESKEGAEKFMEENGGKIDSLDSLFVSTSYRGMTMPFRIPSAAVPSAGVFNKSAGFNIKRSDHLLRGDDQALDAESYGSGTMVPHTMTMRMYSLGYGYGLTDDVFSSVMIPYVEKKMVSHLKNGNTSTMHTSGLGDISLMTRWRFWHDIYFDKHLALMGTVGFPTGEYDSTIRDKSTMQIGSGAFSFTPGLLYSRHIREFWFHAAATYKINLENSDDYKFGDEIGGGLALHWLPNTSDLLGFEVDINKCLKNEYKGAKVLKTGRTSIYGNLVYQRKILLCFGGNLNANFLFGVPFYEDVKEVQLGELYHASAGLQWQRKF